ncbi:MAG: tRNA (adenosine(37)-N6)-dimethylallyltransferase MiaA [Proteobacteria bacterium]|nr:tRNA (adenosine(37)-N6)-dimethylallyltransferase MiaA [Pseudomonadota bacterium]
MADAEAHSFEDEEQRGKRTSVRDRGSDEVFGRMGPAGAHSRLASKMQQEEVSISAPLLVLAGPTSAGKSDAAIEVALRFDAVILSADAMQVYRKMDIGTGKVSVEEQQLVPHEGIDIVDPDQSFNAADFIALTDEVMSRHDRVVVAGGSSLYIRSMIRGLVPAPPVDPAYRRHLEAATDLHEQLALVDPPLAARLHFNDRVRLIRGLEVHQSTGRRLSDLQAEHATMPDRIRAVGVWLDRPNLAERINARVHMMVDAGYVAEVSALLDSGYSRELKPMQSLGYRYFCAHLLDSLPLDEAIRLTQRDTRHFSRKQRNWKRQLGFVEAFDDHCQAAMEVAEQLWDK